MCERLYILLYIFATVHLAIACPPGGIEFTDMAICRVITLYSRRDKGPFHCEAFSPINPTAGISLAEYLVSGSEFGENETSPYFRRLHGRYM